jgi:inhibitor of cysteine peptidase
MNKRQLTSILVVAVSVILFFALFFAIRGARNDKIMETTAGESFTITLDSNPTAGYKWRIAQQIDTGLLELIDSRFIAPKTNLVGAPGQEKWHFKAIKTGKAIISFDYIRPWEKDELPAQRETFIVIIR